MVNALPTSIGKFGGDTDNLEWRRYTDDFSPFIVYADKDGNPADYSPDNVPLKPKHFLPVNLK
ncbi:MAG: S46 family peptidase [Flavobacteriales bacterium AspAUS03]